MQVLHQKRSHKWRFITEETRIGGKFHQNTVENCFGLLNNYSDKNRKQTIWHGAREFSLYRSLLLVQFCARNVNFPLVYSEFFPFCGMFCYYLFASHRIALHCIELSWATHSVSKLQHVRAHKSTENSNERARALLAAILSKWLLCWFLVSLRRRCEKLADKRRQHERNDFCFSLFFLCLSRGRAFPSSVYTFNSVQ